MASRCSSAALQAAADAIGRANAMLIAAGAGMGVDSGLPDFRGPQGFWRAYPALERLGLRFQDTSNPRLFHEDPELVWGFFIHRYQLYRKTCPHAGFQMLKQWADRKTQGAFVFTSNVDGQFQEGGFDPMAIVECHGSLFHLQCTLPCSQSSIWPVGNDLNDVVVDSKTMRVSEDALPRCPSCQRLARPNVLMFGDHAWRSDIVDAQVSRFYKWQRSCRDDPDLQMVIVEIGAGTAVPTVRLECDAVLSRTNYSSGHYQRRCHLIRINPNDNRDTGRDVTCIELPCLKALQQVQTLLP
ncbi:Deacetylase sirtuin-type domain-containing protein [Plasmodiophora brassicae]